MKNRITVILASLALASVGLIAHAEGNAGDRCLAAAEQGDAQKVVDACKRALEADPKDERARAALDAAKAKLAKAHGMEDPAKLNQH